MSRKQYEEPTAEQCSQEATICEDEESIAFACWYPQMGGYAGKAIVETQKSDSCFDVFVWHDGEWPFHEGEPPTPMHHCCPEQFIEFGKLVLKKQGIEEDDT